MKAVVQRVQEARVEIDGETVGSVGRGLLILLCAEPRDRTSDAEGLAVKIAKLRIFQDQAGKMNLSVKDIGGGALVVSQFTLAADTTRGNRPSFVGAAAPDLAEALCEDFVSRLADEGVPIATGRFGAAMKIHLVNDGPVTIWLDTGAR